MTDADDTTTREQTMARDLMRALCERDVEIERLRRALEFIAHGDVSPAIDFARRVLAGADPSEVLRRGGGGE